ncbi:hypothetical protein RJ641_020522 [Dillenia turbinata]|uniref:Uncharacterized protein n=1 Tax=Dillenia turbinata TaxID=194707 RepID=A0AAN8YWZ6_9MAGN
MTPLKKKAFVGFQRILLTRHHYMEYLEGLVIRNIRILKLVMLLIKANIHQHSQTILTINCRALPQGSPSKNSQWPRLNPGQRGGLEIVFNQQLTRLESGLKRDDPSKIVYAAKRKNSSPCTHYIIIPSS